jgi:Tol biopolymer transport system component
LAFTRLLKRDEGTFEIDDIYTISTQGGQEKRLTDTPGIDDGPDYTLDGQYIYWNSERTGLMKIWRMRADGSQQEQVTNDLDYADWFPHPSPGDIGSRRRSAVGTHQREAQEGCD